MQRKIRLNRISLCFMVSAIVFSYSIYFYLGNNIINVIFKACMSIMPLICMVAFRKHKVNKRLCITLGTYYIITVLCCTLMVSLDTFASFLFRFFIFVPLMAVFFHLEGHKAFLRSFINVMIVFSIISLFFWILGSTLHILSPTGQLFVDDWGKVYRDIYFGLYVEIPISALGLPVYRNTGVFGEAPAFCLFLCIALASEVYFGECKLSKIIVLGFTILSTVSTTGFLTIFYMIIVLIWKKMSDKHISLSVRFFLSSPFVTVLAFLLKKIMYGKNKTASVGIRMADYINGFKAWIKSPVIGYGYQISTEVYQTGYSNSLTLILVNGGLLFSLLYIWGFWGYIKYGLKCQIEYFYFGVLLILLFCVNISAYTYLMLALIALGISLLSRKELKVEG